MHKGYDPEARDGSLEQHLISTMHLLKWKAALAHVCVDPQRFCFIGGQNTENKACLTVPTFRCGQTYNYLPYVHKHMKVEKGGALKTDG